jgi:two-component system sensor histidine kinase and response regulator WspE
VAEGGDIKDLSMLDLFRLEADNQTSVLAAELLELEQNPSSEQKLETLMRAAHSMKGAARIVGMETVVRLAHKMEDCFVAAQRGGLELQSNHIDVLLNAVDIILKIAHLPEPELQPWLLQQQDTLAQLEQRLDAILRQKQSITKGKLPVEPIIETKRIESAAAGYPENAAPAQALEEPVLRINAQRVTRLMGLSSELMVEARWLRPYADSMLQLKKRYGEISGLLEKLREGLSGAAIGQHHADMITEAQRKLIDCRSVLTEKILALDDYDRRNSNLSSQMYIEVLASRMRPFAECTQGLQRMARDMARKLGKEVKVVFDGLDTPVDRDILDKLQAPLSHLVRNAIDHGLEDPKRRIRLGKNSKGSVTVQAQQLGGMLVVTVSDDGQGIDLSGLKNKILQKGLVVTAVLENLSEAELLEFLYLPDFSTRDEVTEYSGRGVGLDVVRNLVHEGRGSIRITTTQGEGSKFTLHMPLSMSVVSGLLVNVAGEPYAFPLSRVELLASIEHEQLRVLKSHQYAEINGEMIGLVYAQHLFGGSNDWHCRDSLCHIVVIANQNKKYGVIVDGFVGQKDLAVQTLDPRLGKVQDISAAALTEDGQPVLIIDVDDLFRSLEAHIAEGEAGQQAIRSAVSTPAMGKAVPAAKTVLVIDDSMTVREIERQLLQSQGYRVDVAVDGIDGWNAVRRKKYDLIITDVDMPRMDGIEFLHAVRQDNHLKTLPVMIVSYKDRPEDKQRGMDAGADYYLTKGSFHDETLIEAVVDLIGEAFS